ncbi:MAG TPA: ATP-binding protein [Gemmatimonadaceae bacterium]|nr:ATP-binding protein [Gemmatimonadaceae bacterium]
MRFTPSPSPVILTAYLDPRRIVRWLYVGRLSLAAAIFLAALFVWEKASSSDTRVAAIAFAATAAFTAAAVWWTELQRGRLTRTFLYLQIIFDLGLVTATVHVTGGGESQFSALYILVIATASLLLPIGGGLLVAMLGNVLYFADAILGRVTVLDLRLWAQLGVFALVAAASGYLGARLQEMRHRKEELQAQLAMVQLEARDILRNIRSGIITVDAGGHLLYANPAASTLLGHTLDANLGRPVLDLLREVAPELARALERTVHDGVRVNRGEALVTAGERRFPIGVTTTCMDEDAARPTTATAIFQDISDQKRIETLRLRAERLEGVAELSASLAHEIKNPLASIRSAVEQLSRLPHVADDERTLTGLVIRESDRLSRLLTEFLDFARVRVTRIERVDVGAVARGAANLAGAHPDRQEGVHVTCTAPEQPLIVEADEDLLHRAVFNLTLNAVQATRASGHVRVEVGPAHPDALPAGVAFDGGAVAVRVTDDGPGIDPTVRERLFDPFITTKPGGSGLGLPVVQRAVEAHRGIVLVDSGPRGTRFTVFLPRTQSVTGGHA